VVKVVRGWNGRVGKSRCASRDYFSPAVAKAYHLLTYFTFACEKYRRANFIIAFIIFDVDVDISSLGLIHANVIIIGIKYREILSIKAVNW
jgi:hypothetical protein